LQVFRRETLDFVLFFSSISSFIKNGGMSGYSAGCTFQDAYAALLRRELDCAVKVVNWGYWEAGTGLAIPETSRNRMAGRGVQPLTEQAGMAGLEALLAGSLDQAVVISASDGGVLEIGEEDIALDVGAAGVHGTLARAMSRLPDLPAPDDVLCHAAVFYGSAMEAPLARLLHATLAELDLLETDDVLNGPAFFRRWLGQSRAFLDGFAEDESTSLADAWADWVAHRDGWLADTDLRAAAVLLEDCMRALPEILRGERPATDVLFPGASMERVEGIYKGNRAADHFNEVLADTVVALVEARASAAGESPARLFEIGAGTGGTSAGVFRALAPHAAAVGEYCYTDLSKAFLFHAHENYAEDAPYLTTKIFDVTRAPEDQDVETGSYDMVIAANVLHATANIRETLRNAKAILRPGGVLLMNELSEASLLAHLTFGLLEGWWLNEDDAIRIPGSPGLEPETWARVLREEGFRNVVFPAASSLELGQQIIGAESDGVTRRAADRARTRVSAAPVVTPDSVYNPSTPDTPTSESLAVDLRVRARALVTGIVAAALRMEPDQIDPAEPLERYGIDSILITRITSELRERFGEIGITLLFDMPNADALVDYLIEKHAARLEELCGHDSLETPVEAVAASVSSSAPVTAPRVATCTDTDDGAIAIVGMSGRYPGAETLTEFWANLESGRDCITEIPADRWSLEGFYESDPARAAETGRSYSKWGGFLNDVATFDPLFFGIAPQEALRIDPQERLFLQAAWAALEDAGYTRDYLAETFGKRVGVFAGVTRIGYGLYGPEMWQAGESMFPYTSFSSVANRVSHSLDLIGPSMPVDTMCSSSLTAIHEACEHIMRGECEAAIAGGVNLYLHPSSYANLSANRMLSPDGQCKAFGAGGDGFVPGEGVGVIVLKPLAHALEAGERVHAVIRATAVNHGGRTHGYTVPSPHAQAALVRGALDRAGINARQVTYIEAHGTGTELGDPIEIDGLTQAFRADTDETGFCAVGSVKSAIGHLEASAGIAGLTRAVLQMQHGRLAPSLHADTLNPHIEFATTPFTVQRVATDWPRPYGGTRIAGVSAFGAGGVNAHVLVEEYIDADEAGRRARLEADAATVAIVLSARGTARLREAAENLRDFFSDAGADAPALADLAYTLQCGRETMDHRLGFVAASVAEVREALSCALDDWPEGGEPAIGANVWFGAANGRAGDAPASGDLSALVEAWVDGVDVDWAGRYAGLPVRRVSLPTYPFARDRYWMPDTSTLSTAGLDKRLATAELPPAANDPVQEAIGTALLMPVWDDSPRREENAHHERHWVAACGLRSDVLKHVALPDDAEIITLEVEGESAAARYMAASVGLLVRLGELLCGPCEVRGLFQLLVPVDDCEWMNSGLAALLRTAQAETPGLDVRLIEVSADVQPEEIAAELAQAVTHDHVRCHANGRQVLSWDEIAPMSGSPVWREDGVYLVTGGAGGLGRIVTEDILAHTSAARVVVCGRRPAGESGVSGLRIAYRQADVARMSDVTALVAHIEKTYGRLDGVIHAAGIVDDAAIPAKNSARVRDVIAPKVAGTVNLDLATRALDPEFFMLFSSCAAVRGNPGQADYAAANGFMDAYAHQRAEEIAASGGASRTLSLGWPLWRDGGMRMLAPNLVRLRDATGMVPMPASVGLGALHAALAHARGNADATRIMVLHGVLDRLLPLFGGAGTIAATTENLAEDAPDDIRAMLVAAIRETLMIPAESELNERASFIDLGIDSIHIGRFMRSLSDRLGTELRETLVFDHPSIGVLADHLAAGGATVPAREVVSISLPAPACDDLAQRIAHHPELVALDLAGDGPLLFCVHPMSGDVGLYDKLAGVSDGSFRVVGIRAKGFLTDDVPCASVEEMGRHYAELVTSVDPDGPWHLLGTSMGGTAGYETARTLQEAGGTVDSLTLLEAPLVASRAEASLWFSDGVRNLLMNANFLLITMLHLDPEFRRRKAAGEVAWSGLEIGEDELNRVTDPDALVDRLVELVRGRGVTQAAPVLAQRLRSMARVHEANLRAFARYRAAPLPRPGETRITMLRTRSATAVSEGIFNPDYLANVQHFCGGLGPLLENWRAAAPEMRTHTVVGENHFDLFGGTEALRSLGDAVAAHVSGAPDRVMGPADASRAIAVIGMSGRFPGASSLDEFWELLKTGGTAFGPLPADRGWREVWGVEGDVDGIAYGAFLDAIDKFDPVFFEITPNDAAYLDPAERLFLEEAWRAVVQSGLDPAGLAGARWGVFCGGGGDYTQLIDRLEGYSPHVTGSGIPARVSYSLGLTGPCVSTDSGCASSAQAIAQACDQLLLGHCEVAIAGGVNVQSTPNLIHASHASGILSGAPRGQVLDADAGGMMPAEGVGVVILKPLDQALADGDAIQGVIEGWGANHSGRTNGMSAPSVKAQRGLGLDVLERYGIDPETVSLVELNATGTALGDLMEIEALADCVHAPAWIGSVENNIGHSFESSGVAHLLKVLLAMRYGEIPATVAVDQPLAALTDTPFRFNTEHRDWEAGADGARRAVVNSFGATGTNVQIILRDASNARYAAPELAPPVPFDRRRCWLDAPGEAVAAPTSAGNGSAVAVIAALVREMTGHEEGEIDPTQALSRYGLDSLLTMHLLARINEHFGSEIQLADLAEKESIEWLASLAGSLSDTGAPDPSEGGRAASWLSRRLLA
jgi:acyl transferase domain-containing protein/thioesterase domain-containing protein/NAD(P)-dependent dehydrogenase (short-subunit alcohol dehydrogenase family)/SAM-dependent methyltransferase